MGHGRQRVAAHRAGAAVSTWLIAVSAAAAATPPADALISRANHSQIDVDYAVNPDAAPVESVALWITFDAGEHWQKYGEDADRHPPMTFAPPQEGLCGLYFVLTNEAGASGASPTSTTEPQLWLFVDYTPPIAQIHPPEVESRDGHRVVHLRWTALDANLIDRPVDLAYRVVPNGPWQDVRTRLANVGTYDWTAPDEQHGELMFRLTVTDRGGNTSEAATPAVALDGKPGGKPESSAGDDAHATPLSPADQKRVRALLHRARLHELREEHDAAIERLRAALAIDPRCTSALVELGGSLYALGRYEEAASAFDLALTHAPQNEDALAGLADALIALKRYEAAAAKLQSVLQEQPRNAAAWLQLGDIAMYRGQELEARENYQKAATVRPEAAAAVARARMRLADLNAERTDARGASHP